jgi:biopolymer transport protein ExbD
LLLHFFTALGMKVYLEPDDLDVRIEIVPLIDVIFCILVFFILGAVNIARLQGLNIDLPKAETAKTQFSDTLPVEIDALGQIRIDNATLNESQLKQILTAYVKQKPDGVVVVNADKLVSYGQVAQLIDTLQKVGGTRVALGTVPQAPTPETTPGSLDLNPPLSPTLPGSLNQSPDLAPPLQPLPSPTLPGVPNSLAPSQPNPLNPSPVPSSTLPTGTPSP